MLSRHLSEGSGSIERATIGLQGYSRAATCHATETVRKWTLEIRKDGDRARKRRIMWIVAKESELKGLAIDDSEERISPQRGTNRRNARQSAMESQRSQERGRKRREEWQTST